MRTESNILCQVIIITWHGSYGKEKKNVHIYGHLVIWLTKFFTLSTWNVWTGLNNVVTFQRWSWFDLSFLRLFLSLLSSAYKVIGQKYLSKLLYVGVCFVMSSSRAQSYRFSCECLSTKVVYRMQKLWSVSMFRS